MIWNRFRQRSAAPPSEPPPDEAPAATAPPATGYRLPATDPADYGETLAPTRGGLFGAIRQLFRTSRRLDTDFWDELEELLLAADVGAMTTARLTETLQRTVRAQGITDAGQAEEALKAQLIRQLVSDGGPNCQVCTTLTPSGVCEHGRPPALALPPDDLAVILVIGVNGVGKTTTIAKLATWLQHHAGRQCLLAAGDTFRAGAIDQLKIWGERTGCQVIAHQAGADPGAVVFDALAAARSRGADCVIVDTAGRLHTKVNLMAELGKVRRTIARQEAGAPHETLLVLDAVTGQNAIIQAKAFTETIGVTGVVLTKLDSTAKGGVVLAVSEELGVPVKFVGTGEHLDALTPFDPHRFVGALFQRD